MAEIKSSKIDTEIKSPKIDAENARTEYNLFRSSFAQVSDFIFHPTTI